MSCEYDRLNGWNLTLQAAWYIRHVRWTCLFYTRYFFYNMFFCELNLRHGFRTSRSFIKSWKTSAVSTTVWYGWNSTLQAAWYIIHVRIIWFLWCKPTILLLILRFTQNIVRACSVFYPYEGYRSVTPLDAARVNRTIFHNHSVHRYYITLIRGDIIVSTTRYINVRHDKQNPCIEGGGYIKHDIIHNMINRRVLTTLWTYYYRYLLYLLWYFDAWCIICCWGISAMFTGDHEKKKKKKVKKRQLWVRPFEWLKLNFASSDTFVRVIIWFLRTKPTIWLLILTVLNKISFARVLCFILLKDIGRWLPWMLPWVNRSIFHNHYNKANAGEHIRTR